MSKRAKIKKRVDPSSFWSKTSIHTRNQVSSSKTVNFNIKWALTKQKCPWLYKTCSACFLNHILCLYTCSKCLLLQITLHWKIILHLFMKGKSNINVTIVVLLLIIFLSWNIILHLFMKEKSNIIVIDVVLILRNRLTLKIILHQSMKVKRLILKIR